MRFRSIIYVVGFVVVAGCQGTEEKDPCKELDEIDFKMNALYKEVIEDYQDNNLFLKRWRTAQVDWIQYRDSYARSIWPKDKSEYGENYVDCKCALLRDLTEERVEQIRMWLVGNRRFEDCGGSMLEREIK